MELLKKASSTPMCVVEIYSRSARTDASELVPARFKTVPPVGLLGFSNQSITTVSQSAVQWELKSRHGASILITSCSAHSTDGVSATRNAISCQHQDFTTSDGESRRTHMPCDITASTAPRETQRALR